VSDGRKVKKAAKAMRKVTSVKRDQMKMVGYLCCLAF